MFGDLQNIVKALPCPTLDGGREAMYIGGNIFIVNHCRGKKWKSEP